MADLASMASLAGLPGLVVPGASLGPAAAAEARRRSSRPGGGGGGGGSGDGGVNPEEQDHLYPGGYSADGVRAPIPNRRDRLIGASGDHGPGGGGGGGAVLGGMMMQGAMGAMGGAAEESDDVDWIFNIPEVCCGLDVVFRMPTS